MSENKSQGQAQIQEGQPTPIMQITPKSSPVEKGQLSPTMQVKPSASQTSTSDSSGSTNGNAASSSQKD